MLVGNIGTTGCYSYPGSLSMYGKAYHCLLVIVLFIMPLTDCGEDWENGIISPTEPYVLSGREITLTCVINTTARNLTFTRGQNGDLVKEIYIERLNTSAIKMVLPNTEAINIREQRYIFFQCVDYYEDKIQKHYKCVHVQMEYFPVPPKNISCRVYHWLEMYCTWDLGIKYVNESNVDVECVEIHSLFSLPSDLLTGINNNKPCPQQTRNSSFWNETDFDDAMLYTINVTVRNKVTNESATATFRFLRDDVVEPESVKDLTVNISMNQSCVIVRWNMPDTNRHHFLCIISYQSECHSGEQTHYCDTGMPNVQTICTLQSHVLYNFSVVSRQNRTTNFGYFSKPVSEEIVSPRNCLFTTISACVSPETTEGLYDDKNLYWKPLNICESYAKSVKYIISNGNESKSEIHPSFSSSLLLPKAQVISDGNESKSENRPSVLSSLLLPKAQVTILGENDCGSANKTSTLDIFSTHAAPPRSNLAIEFNISGSCYNIFATIIEDDSNNEMFSNISHTIVWCLGTITCQKAIEWRILEIKETTFQHCSPSYRYGLITKGLHKGLNIITNTGIDWTTCSYEIGKVPERQLMSNLAEHQGPRSVHIEWEHYECGVAGYVTHYLVTYCHMKNTNTNGQSCSCGENSIKVKVSNHKKMHEVSNLKAGTHICIWVEAIVKGTISQLPIKSFVYTITDKDVSHMYAIIIVVVVVVVVLVLGICAYCMKRIWNARKTNLESINMNLQYSFLNKHQASPTEDLSEIENLLSESVTNSNAEDTSGVGTSTFQRSETGTNRDHWNHSSSDRHRTSHLNTSQLNAHVSVHKNVIGSYGNPLFIRMVPGPKCHRNSSGDYASDVCLDGYSQATDVELNYGVTDTDSVISDGVQISKEKIYNITHGDSDEIHSRDKCVEKKFDFDREDGDESINLNKEENGKFEMQCNIDSSLEAEECDDGLCTKCVNNSDLNINDCGGVKFSVMLPEANSCEFIIQDKFHQSTEMTNKICDYEDELSDESEYLSGYKTHLNAAEPSDDLCETYSNQEKLHKAMEHSVSFKSQDSSMRDFSANSRISDIQYKFKDEVSNDQENINKGEFSAIISDSLSEIEDTSNNSKPTLKNYTNVKSLDLSAIDIDNSDSSEVSLEECEVDGKELQISNTECVGVMKSETNELPEMLLYEKMKTRENQKETIIDNNKKTGFVVCNGSDSSYSYLTVDNNQQFLKADPDKAFKNKMINDKNCINGTMVINGLKNS